MAKKISPEEIQFHKLIQVLADQCGYKMSEITLSLYDEALSPYGYENVNRGLKSIFNTRKGGDRFPSVADILEQIGITVSDRMLAVDCANMIIATFGRWKNDYTSRDDFEQQYREKIGDLPWEVVQRMGGYRTLYKEWDQTGDLSTFRAQVRDSALAILGLTKNFEYKELAACERKLLNEKK